MYRLLALFSLSWAITTSPSHADPLIIDTGKGTPKIHCSIAKGQNGVDLWAMFGEPFEVMFDDDQMSCLSAEERLAQNKVQTDKLPRIANPRPGVRPRPSPWCYCRREVAEYFEKHLDSLTPELSTVIADFQGADPGQKQDDISIIPDGLTAQNAEDLYRHLGLTSDGTEILKQNDVRKITPGILQQFRNGSDLQLMR